MSRMTDVELAVATQRAAALRRLADNFEADGGRPATQIQQLRADAAMLERLHAEIVAQRSEREVLAKRVCESLNHAAALDPAAIHSLLCNRVPTQRLLADPHFCVDMNRVLPGHWTADALGLVNCALLALGLPPLIVQLANAPQILFEAVPDFEPTVPSPTRWRGDCHVQLAAEQPERTLGRYTVEAEDAVTAKTRIIMAAQDDPNTFDFARVPDAAFRVVNLENLSDEESLRDGT